MELKKVLKVVGDSLSTSSQFTMNASEDQLDTQSAVVADAITLAQTSHADGSAQFAAICPPI